MLSPRRQGLKFIGGWQAAPYIFVISAPWNDSTKIEALE